MLNKYTISQLVLYIKTKLTDDMCLQNISVEGEIGNFINHSSGHWYFSLKDSNALINCVMFKYSRQSDFIPINGDKVILYGNVNIYEKSGQIQIQGIRLEKVGNGDFYAQYEKIKNKLLPLGYFDLDKKKEIPKYCDNIAIITGANTAALQDVKRTINLRWPMSNMHHISAIMQGESAASSCINALIEADKLNCDVILLVRGGGSVDDLFCFNDEALAKQIFLTNTPVITGIGHEIDFTIADLVADYRSATPTAAAEKCTPDQKEELNQLNIIRNKLDSYIIYKMNSCAQDIDIQNEKIQKYSKYILEVYNSLKNYKQQLQIYLSNSLERNSLKMGLLSDNLKESYKKYFEKKKEMFINLINTLEILSPLNVLIKGYTVTSQGNKVIKCISEVDFSKVIKTRFKDGVLISTPKERE